MKAWRLFLVLDAIVLAAAAVAFVSLHDGHPRTVRTGVVLVDANLGGGTRTEGTGIVLTRDGEVLTNNHVIEGARSVRVVDPQSHRVYVADILGYDLRVDAAVLRLRHAHDLRTASTVSRPTHVGQEILAVGGSSGSVKFAVGHITGLNASVTAGDETGGQETLRGVISFDAAVAPGDSGGPLLDLLGNVVGVDTAGGAKPNFYEPLHQDHQSYAIPIRRALGVVHAIEAGRGSKTLHVGATAYLGVELDPLATRLGATVVDSVDGSPASKVGLVAGARITAADGASITGPDQLVAVLLAKRPGDSLELEWADDFGRHLATVKLVPGPAL